MKKSDKFELKAHNDVNGLMVGNLSEKEIDVFRALMFELQNKEMHQIVLSKNEMKKLVGLDRKSDERYISVVQSFFQKIKTTDYVEWNGSEERHIILFDEYKINHDTGEITISATPKFSRMLSNLQKNWFIMQIAESRELNSKYAKIAYSLLKQYRNSGYAKFGVDEFKLLLGVPESYETANMNRVVLKPIMTGLSKIFENLQLEKVKEGRKVTKYIFTFTPEEQAEKPKQQPKSNKIVVPAPAWSGQEYKDTTSEDDKNKFAEWQRKLKEMK